MATEASSSSSFTSRLCVGVRRLVSAAISMLAILGGAGAIIEQTNGCSPSCGEERWGYPSNIFDDKYQDSKLNMSLSTNKGIRYDATGLQTDPDFIDRLTDEVESCLVDSGRLKAGGIDRGSFVVKLESEWQPSCDRTQQLLPVAAPSQLGCIQKGLTPTESCVCKYRAGIRCPNVLITTPSMFLYKDVLIRLVLDIDNPWIDSTLALCASPAGQDPLGMGER